MASIENLSPALEALIFASGGPAMPGQIRKVFPDLTPAKLAEAVRVINTALDKEGRPYQIAQVAGGYQFRTRPEYSEVLRAAQPDRKVRLSRAALETLAVVSYKQPATRAEIEDLRSVDCGAILKSLMERDLVRIVGRRDAPGRPVLYGTTSSFLEIFGLPSLSDLPSLRDIATMIEEQGTPAGADPADADAEAAADAVAGEPADDEEFGHGPSDGQADEPPDQPEGDATA